MVDSCHLCELKIPLSFSGIIADQQASIFSYSSGDSFSDYFFPSFEPMFEVTFSDASLEQSANDICGDDFSCRFDIATTGSTTIGLSTLMEGQELAQIVSLSQPSKYLKRML